MNSFFRIRIIKLCVLIFAEIPSKWPEACFLVCHPQIKCFEKCVRMVQSIIRFIPFHMPTVSFCFVLFSALYWSRKKVMSNRIFACTICFHPVVWLQKFSTNTSLFNLPSRKRMWQCTQGKLITFDFEENFGEPRNKPFCSPLKKIKSVAYYIQNVFEKTEEDGKLTHENDYTCKYITCKIVHNSPPNMSASTISRCDEIVNKELVNHSEERSTWSR